VQAQIREIVTAESRQHREELLRRLGSEDAANPLVAMQVRIGKKLVETEERHRQEVERLRESHTTQSRAMQTQVSELKEHLARLLDKQGHDLELAEAEAAGTRKGLSFEDRVHDAIESIAGARGDLALHTGSAQAEGGGKKGDTLVEIGACEGTARGRVVFEAKDNQMTKNKAWSELNAAMTARAASFGVLVVAGEDNVPAGREALTEYEGNKLIVAVDREDPERTILEAAYGIARARALAARQDELALDAPAMKEAIEEARRGLESLKTARQALTGVRKNADSIESALAAMEETAKAALARADSLIADALEAAS
jgi:hypothetical protein